MAASEQVNVRLSPNRETKRPLSTYDNLNTIDATTNSSDSDGISSADDRPIADNVNGFPFGDISFRFDELQNRQSNQFAAHNNNNNRGINSINNNNSDDDDTNYKFPPSNGNHSENAPIKNSSHLYPRGHAITVDPMQFPTQNHQYEDISGDPDVYRQITGKPVHSDAKSLFLGLTQNGGNEDGKSFTHAPVKPLRATQQHIKRLDSSEKTPFEDNVDSQEEEPLLDGPSPGRQVAYAQYQNVPANSVCFGGKTRTTVTDCCKCTEITSTEIDQCNGDEYKCTYCRSTISQTISTANGTINNDLASCSTLSASSKATKSVALDNSSSYRKSQALSQVSEIIKRL